MANVEKIISDFRFDCNADTSQISDTQALWLLNRVYRDFINEIRSINEDYFYNYWDTNTEINVDEYKMTRKTETIPWIVKIKGVSVKYDVTETDYTKATLETMNNLPNDLYWYKDKQPKSQPFYTISDKSIFLFPTPDKVAPLRLYWIADPIDLKLDTEDDWVKIPAEYHYLLPLGMKRYYFASRFMLNEKNDALAELNMEKQKMLKNLSLRQISPVQITEPILSNLY